MSIDRVEFRQTEPPRLEDDTACPCSLRPLMSWCRAKIATLSQSINTVALFSLGFDLHRMHRWARAADPFMSSHTFPGVKIPTFHFATLPTVTSEIYYYHRDEGPFVIDNGEGSIFAYIVDMLRDASITPDNIIFTSSTKARGNFTLFLNDALGEKRVHEKQYTLQRCAQEALKNWASADKVNVTVQARHVVCDMMSRYFFGCADTDRSLSFAMTTFFDYIQARFGQKSFDKTKISDAREKFWSAINTAFANPQSLAFTLRAKMQDVGLTEKETKMMLFSLFFAGIDSTTQSLIYLIYECAKDQALQHSLRNEAEKVELLILEALRLFPPVIGVDRVAREDCELVSASDGSQTVYHKIAKGDRICPAPSIIARCPFLFPNKPNEFIPARWEGNTQSLISLPWLPFGSGKSLCPGWRLYKNFTEFFLTKMLQNYSLKLLSTAAPAQTGSFINKLSKEVVVTVKAHEH
ncbi:MAG: cytochrome P450 [Verrucomicrobia bacterium]|nr:cytochrome P450 [Verrucomicrobiota bacterium]